MRRYATATSTFKLLQQYAFDFLRSRPFENLRDDLIFALRIDEILRLPSPGKAEVLGGRNLSKI